MWLKFLQPFAVFVSYAYGMLPILVDKYDGKTELKQFLNGTKYDSVVLILFRKTEEKYQCKQLIYRCI